MKRALISVFDKTGVVELAESLAKEDWEIYSTGGTYKLLKESGIKVKSVEDLTKFQEILDGRVKTLHPMIHGGILYKRSNLEHKKTIEELGIFPIHMVVCNLYPFEATLNKEGVTHSEIIENIDIGGPTMLRSAAKNYESVIVITDPKDYSRVIGELKAKHDLSLELKSELAGKVYNHTALYDSMIANYFNDINKVEFPQELTKGYRKKTELRYGENPHQKAAFYIELGNIDGTIASAKKLHGKELSYNNINDANGAIKLLKEFDEPTAVAVKHANPCGVGSSETIYKAFMKAYECDKESIFGGIVALNREVDIETATILNSIFLEVIIAPAYTEEAFNKLSEKANVRILELELLEQKNKYIFKQVEGAILLQQEDTMLLQDDIEIASKLAPQEEELEDLIFAWKVAKHINSNGVVIAKDKATIGIGLGEVNRYWAVKAACERAGDKTNDAVIASDGFFPFSDSIEHIAKCGVKAIIQPGGSIKDSEVIEAADKNEMCMLLTKIRHFKH